MAWLRALPDTKPLLLFVAITEQRHRVLLDCFKIEYRQKSSWFMLSGVMYFPTSAPGVSIRLSSRDRFQNRLEWLTFAHTPLTMFLHYTLKKTSSYSHYYSTIPKQKAIANRQKIVRTSQDIVTLPRTFNPLHYRSSMKLRRRKSDDDN